MDKFSSVKGISAPLINKSGNQLSLMMNIDTDMQYAFMTGVRDYFNDKSAYLKAQIGNPDGEDVPNKKYYDPRKWLRLGEETFNKRLTKAFEDLNNLNTLD